MEEVEIKTEVSAESVEELVQEIYDLEDDCEEYSRRIEELETKLASKDLKKLEDENASLRKEIQASYKHNEAINKWWKFKLERLELSHSHPSVVITTTDSDKPWVHYDKPNE